MKAPFFSFVRRFSVGVLVGALISIASPFQGFAATDTTAPTVSSVTPTTAATNVATTFSATYSDDVGVASCNFFVGLVNRGAMTLADGKATISFTFTSAGSKTVSVKCTDAAGNLGTGASTTVTVSSDTTAPTVSAVTPTTAVANTPVTVSATYSDAIGVASCNFYTGLVDRGAMTLAGGKATLSYTFTSTTTVSVKCTDTSENVGTGASTTITVAVDNIAPTVGTPTPTTGKVGESGTLTATYSDAVGVASCTLYFENDALTMTLQSGTASYSGTFESAGTYSAYVACTDTSGNVGTSSTISFVVSSAVPQDLTAPTVSSVTPTTATAGVSTTFSATYSDAVGVVSCTGYANGGAATATLVSGTASITGTLSPAGTYTLYMTCVDAAGNIGTGPSTTVIVSAASTDTTAPTVSAITPTTATAGVSTTFTATYSDAVGVTGCTGYANGSPATATLSSGKATVSGTMVAGTYTLYMTCVDAAGNVGTGTSTTVVVSPASTDTTAPTVSSVTPTTAIAGVTTTFKATYSDAVGVVSCTGYANGEGKSMALSSGTASISGAFESAGTYTLYVTCTDAAGNIGTGATTTVTVSAASTDTTAPTIGLISPTTATQNTAATFSATVTDASGVYECRLYVNGVDQGPMTASSSTYSRSYTSATSGSITAYAHCGDMIGNVGAGTAVTITVAAAATTLSDTTAPTVSALVPSTATAGTAVTLSASVADSGGMGTCVLYVNSTYIGSMTIASGYATRSYTFSSEGTAIGNAYCVDAAGNATRGASTTFTIAAAEEVIVESETAVSEADPGSLIKLACESGADVNDPCRAVYYYDTVVGKRHAFPNEKVFFTWFIGFDDVVVVTEEFMSSLTLGRNVTYRPGVKMVKFSSVDTVYVVGEAGELRGIDSEDTAKALFGEDWNQQIDDISDAFLSNYSFGTEVTSEDEYDADNVEDSISSIDEIL